MDTDRTLRFLIPSALLFTLLVWGVFLHPLGHSFLKGLKSYPDFGPAVGSLAFIFAFGFVISSLSLSCQWLFFGEAPDIAKIAPDLRDKLAQRLRLKRDPKQDLYIVATYNELFIHGRQPGAYEWLQRRYNSFLVNAHCFTAVILAFVIFFACELLILPYLELELTCYTTSCSYVPLVFLWIVPNMILLVVFGCRGKQSLYENRTMLRFLLTEGNHEFSLEDQKGDKS